MEERIKMDKNSAHELLDEIRTCYPDAEIWIVDGKYHINVEISCTEQVMFSSYGEWIRYVERKEGKVIVEKFREIRGIAEENMKGYGISEEKFTYFRDSVCGHKRVVEVEAEEDDRAVGKGKTEMCVFCGEDLFPF